MFCNGIQFNTLFCDVKKCFTVNDQMQCFEKLLNTIIRNAIQCLLFRAPNVHSLNEHKKRACVLMQAVWPAWSGRKTGLAGTSKSKFVQGRRRRRRRLKEDEFSHTYASLSVCVFYFYFQCQSRPFHFSLKLLGHYHKLILFVLHLF
jgi:hypothetical protein